MLARIVPPQGVEIDPTRRPFVVVDPRAGHGPGIGGFKADSEIGVALKAGHPCYFVGFLPDPMPGQTIEDIARAEAVFLEKVIALHPEADGKPCVIGNCQAGWAIMMLAAMRPELFGPIIVAGSPLSYWAGVRGKNPMRYSGGLLGGSWLTALTSDLGHGKFDGAWLVQNFENQNPANTLWSKQYNLYSKIDTEAPRYLGFERWWGGHVNLNAEEIQFIVDRAVRRQQSRRRRHPDLRRHRDRPAQHPLADRGVLLEGRQHHAAAAGARTGFSISTRTSTRSASYGQTIVYTIHETRRASRHLRFRRRREQGARRVLEQHRPDRHAAARPLRGGVRAQDRGHRQSRSRRRGDWVMRCEARTLDDIRALGGNDAADERRFATAARVSEINLALYRDLRAAAGARHGKLAGGRMDAADASAAAAIRALLRCQSVDGAGRHAWRSRCASDRKPVAADNPFLAMQENASRANRRRRSIAGGT